MLKKWKEVAGKYASSKQWQLQLSGGHSLIVLGPWKRGIGFRSCGFLIGYDGFRLARLRDAKKDAIKSARIHIEKLVNSLGGTVEWKETMKRMIEDEQ